MSTPRDRARAQTMTDITRIGREHLTRYGAVGLSLRAVARDLGVVSSAVYRYVPSRDELLTLLVVDAYDELGDHVDAAQATVDPAEHRARWEAMSTAVRSWGRAQPARYGLLFGSPVPGYVAPAQRTSDPGTRVVALLLQLLVDAESAGAVPLLTDVPAALHDDVERVRGQFGVGLSDAMLAAGVLAWVALFGAVSFEVFGQYGPDGFADDGAAMFGVQVDQVALLLGLA